MWDKESNWPAFEQQAMMKYQAWKAKRKPKHILASIPGIVDVYKSKGYTIEETTYAAKTTWVDTSDEDVPEGQTDDEPDSINFSSETDRDMFADLSIPAKKPSQAFVDPIDKVVLSILKELPATRHDKGEQSDREGPSVVESPSQTHFQGLEDLTNSPDVFGHGSFAGIVMEKPTYMGGHPLSPPHSPLGGEFVVPLDSLSPKEMQGRVGNDMSQKNFNTQSSTSMECSHCHTLPTPKTVQSVSETPRSLPMQPLTGASLHVPAPQSGNSTRAEALRMSQLFTQWISGLLEQQQSFPASILASQEFSQSFK
ncbi:unnamed protein product [Calypogeia fissa]